MTYPSAAINGYKFYEYHSDADGKEGPRPYLWDRSLDKTGQIGESGIWEPVKWQSPGGHHLHTDYVGFKKDYTTDITWEPSTTSLSTGHDYFLNRDLHFLHPTFDSVDRKTQMHIPTGDDFTKDGFNFLSLRHVYGSYWMGQNPRSTECLVELLPIVGRDKFVTINTDH